jgi:hypothetical protein
MDYYDDYRYFGSLCNSSIFQNVGPMLEVRHSLLDELHVYRELDVINWLRKSAKFLGPLFLIDRCPLHSGSDW